MKGVQGVVFYGVQGKMTRRLAGAVVGLQAIAVFFGALVARALGSASGEASAGRWLLVGSVLAVLCIVAAGSLRRPWGITLGWLMQLATLAASAVVPLMSVVGLVFGALWVLALVQGHQLDEHTARVDAAWYDAHPRDAPGPPGPATRHTTG